MTSVELLALLEGVRRSGSGWTARCPAHADGRPSLSINEHDGLILVNCFAGCRTEDVVRALGITMADLFADAPVRQDDEPIRYPYHGPDGRPIFRVCRGPGKRLWQERLAPDGRWVPGAPPPNERVPYRLPQVIEAVRAGQPVIVAEGEKDAEALASLGLVATTNSNGVGKWLAHYSAWLRGARVFILADNDEPGVAHAGAVADALIGVAREVKQILLPGLVWKGDVSDWLAAGGDRKSLAIVCKNAPPHRRGVRLKPSDVPLVGAGTLEPAPPGQLPALPKPERGEVTEPPPSWPVLDPAAYQGLAGEIVRTVEPHIESDPVGVLVQLLVAFGNAVNRGPHCHPDRSSHYLNEFALMVGATSAGRKGTSWADTRALFEIADPDWTARCIKGGLSSGEGLIYHVRDPMESLRSKRATGGEPPPGDPGVPDKRLLVVESEFASVLGRQGRDGNTLSAILRQSWDAGNLQTLTRSEPLRATGAHVSVIGHITQSEVLGLVTRRDAANGYLNRFLIVLIRRARLLPHGGNLPAAEWRRLGDRLGQRLAAARLVGEMGLEPAARAEWGELYRRLEPTAYGAVAGATSRGQPHVRRLACIYALLDGRDVVGLIHLRAAVAVWRYAEASAAHVLGDTLGDPTTRAVAGALESAGCHGLTTTDLHAALNNHATSGQVRLALSELQASGRVQRLDGTGSGRGRPAIRWRWTSLATGSECEESEISEERGITSQNSHNSQAQQGNQDLAVVEV